MEGSGPGALSLGVTLVKEEPECAVTDHVIKKEAELLNEEDSVKEESLCEDAACPHEVSEAAELASLYLDHVVKDELVVGPEDFHQMNIADALYARVHIDILTSTETGDIKLRVGGNGRAPGCNPGEEELMFRDCYVRLERLPRRETRAQPDGECDTEHDIYDRVDYDREPTCDTCGSRFALKSDLMKHVVIHTHMPRSTQQVDARHDVAHASNHTLITAGGCGQTVSRARSSRHALRDCCVRLERIPALEHRAPPHAPPPHSPHTVNNIPHDNAGIETYVCDTCGKTFQQKQDLRRHCQSHTRKQSLPKKQVKIESKPYSCICGKQFKRKIQLKIHNRIHTGETPYSCEICGEQFTYSHSLLVHKRHHTGEKPYTCKICHKRFRQSGDLKTHSRTHTGEKPYSCSTCKKQFSAWGSYNTHTLKHKGEYPYPCEVCEKRFSTKSALRVHNKRAHEGFSCEICNEHFVSVESFRIHTRSVHNTGGPLYTCNVCKRKFTNSFNYKEHKLIHTGEKPHSCVTCGKRFTRLAHLQVHTRYHTGDKRFSCNTCGEQFVEKFTLICHERAQHTGEKPYTCDICQKQFRQKTHLNVHIRVHTCEKPYACEICNKRFTTSSAVKSHNRIHTVETPYSCEICRKRFKRFNTLKVHKRTHSQNAP